MINRFEKNMFNVYQVNLDRISAIVYFSENEKNWVEKGLKFLEKLADCASAGRDLFVRKSLEYGADGSDILLAKREYENLEKELLSRTNRIISEKRKELGLFHRIFLTKKWKETIIKEPSIAKEAWEEIQKLILFTAELDFEVNPWIVIHSSMHSENELVSLIKAISAELKFDIEYNEQLPSISELES